MAADRRVDVEHQHGLLVELLRVLVGPLGRADQAVFLGVPARIDEGPPRLPAILDRRAQGAAHLERGGGPAPRIDRAIDPGVAMVADHHPAIGLDRALERGDHVPDRPDLVVHDDPEVDLDRPRPDVVGQRQPPLPPRWDVRPPQGLQDRPGRVIADRQRGDAGEVVVADQPGLLLPLLDFHRDQGPGQCERFGPERESMEGIDGEPLGALDRRTGGVDGSPGPSERNCTLPRWIADPGRKGPSG